MQCYLAGRMLQAVVSMLVVSMVVFVLARLTGDPLEIMKPAEATKEDITVVRAYQGLDRPWPVQYWRFISRAVQGDFGRSVRFNRPALAVVTERYPATLEFGGPAISIVLALGLPVGVYATVRRNSPLDYVSRGVAALGQAVPPFWLGLVLVLMFGVALGGLPTSGRGTPAHILLPGLTLGWFAVAGLMRLTRSAMLDVLGTEYIKLARMKGFLERQVIWKHASKNAALPVVTFAALLIAKTVSEPFLETADDLSKAAMAARVAEVSTPRVPRPCPCARRSSPPCARRPLGIAWHAICMTIPDILLH